MKVYNIPNIPILLAWSRLQWLFTPNGKNHNQSKSRRYSFLQIQYIIHISFQNDLLWGYGRWKKDNKRSKQDVLVNEDQSA